jgi:hypothetical protein
MASNTSINRVNLFNKCNKKIPELEKLLTMGNEITISLKEGDNLNLDFFERRRSGLIHKLKLENRELAIINFQSSNKTAAHSLILVINEYLPNGWSIFDSNGTKYFPFKILDNKKDVTKKYTTVNINKSLNFGSDSINPGYCGTFGIIFIIFYLKNFNNINWLDEWKQILNLISTKIDDIRGSYAVNIAFEIQKYINKINYLERDNVIDDIYQIISTGVTNINIGKIGGYKKILKKTKNNSKNKKTKKKI